MAKIFIAGDIVLKDCLSIDHFAPELRKRITASDYAIGNFEAPIAVSGGNVLKSGPAICQDPAAVEVLKWVGFDGLMLANNHMMDYGAEGLEATAALIDQHGLDRCGAGRNREEAYQPLIKEIEGVKIGFLNLCESQFGVIDHSTDPEQPGYAWIGDASADDIVRTMVAQCDFTIVLAHAGLEHFSVPQIEWRDRYRRFCELGVDAVVGAHPHVPQGYEYWKGSVIFYSLGNFFFDALSYGTARDNSFSVELSLSKSRPLTFELIYHHKENSTLIESPSSERVNVEALNLSLTEDYPSRVDEMNASEFNKIRDRLLYCMSVPFSPGVFKMSLRRVVSRLLGRSARIDKTAMLRHLLTNESYLNAARHTLAVESKKNSINQR